MKKFRGLLLMAALGCFACLGCGGGSTTTEGQPEPKEEEVDPAAMMGGELGEDPDTATDSGAGADSGAATAPAN
jgi:hypothetical protein